MTANTHKSDHPYRGKEGASIPAGLLDVAYIDGSACAAAGGMSLSQWHSLVKEKKAPQPAIRKPRFTRWLLSDVREWLIQFRKAAPADSESARQVIAQAKKASNAAAGRRRTAAQLPDMG